MRSIFRKSANLVVFRKRDDNASGADLLPLMLQSEPCARFVLGWLCRCHTAYGGSLTIAIPEDWTVAYQPQGASLIRYSDSVPVCMDAALSPKGDRWAVISDGRLVTRTDSNRLAQILAESQADVAAIDVVGELGVRYEKVLKTSRDELVGFRLFYDDAVRPAPLADEWANHVIIMADAANKIFVGSHLPSNFADFVALCERRGLTIRGFNVGGEALDLGTDGGLLSLLADAGSWPESGLQRWENVNSGGRGDCDVSSSARIVGQVLLGRDVAVGDNAVVVGPAILGDRARVEAESVVRTAIVAPGATVPGGSVAEKCVVTDSSPVSRLGSLGRVGRRWTAHGGLNRSGFRQWPRCSYAGSLKRMFDIVVSAFVLILFAPFIPVIAVIVKLTSPGPAFFRDERQGLHGRVFKCLKFRTMRVGADDMQDKLRELNEADGPQFVIPDDPRMSAVGRFLRETYIDEIPQFVNVLMGQMSVVGPRPSPERENRLCPFWRDARLSVRPGITGLWQVCRTRRRMMDFQEWIHYDVKYVRDMSFKQDLWICWQTFMRMVRNFIRQF